MPAFNKTVAEKNKDAIEEQKRLQRRSKAINALLALRKEMLPVREVKIRAAREQGRP